VEGLWFAQFGWVSEQVIYEQLTTYTSLPCESLATRGYRLVLTRPIYLVLVLFIVITITSCDVIIYCMNCDAIEEMGCAMHFIKLTCD